MRPEMVKLQDKKIEMPSDAPRMGHATPPAMKTVLGLTIDADDRASGAGR